MTIRRILCPVDFSPCSDHALEYAIELAGQLGAHPSVWVFHAWELPSYAVPDGALAFGAEVMMRVEDAMKQKVDQLVLRHAHRGVTMHGRVVQGPPAFEIARHLAELEIDLVVMGTHGRTGLAHLVLGSVAERVVRTAGIPVLTVPSVRGERSSP